MLFCHLLFSCPLSPVRPLPGCATVGWRECGGSMLRPAAVLLEPRRWQRGIVGNRGGSRKPPLHSHDPRGGGSEIIGALNLGPRWRLRVRVPCVCVCRVCMSGRKTMSPVPDTLHMSYTVCLSPTASSYNRAKPSQSI